MEKLGLPQQPPEPVEKNKYPDFKDAIGRQIEDEKNPQKTAERIAKAMIEDREELYKLYKIMKANAVNDSQSKELINRITETQRKLLDTKSSDYNSLVLEALQSAALKEDIERQYKKMAESLSKEITEAREKLCQELQKRLANYYDLDVEVQFKSEVGVSDDEIYGKSEYEYKSRTDIEIIINDGLDTNLKEIPGYVYKNATRYDEIMEYFHTELPKFLDTPWLNMQIDYDNGDAHTFSVNFYDVEDAVSHKLGKVAF